jgi:hypothetical protein
MTDRITHSLGNAFKWIQVTTDTSNITLVGNFGVTVQTGAVTFQSAGTWYDYLNGNTFTATGGPQNITLQPGEYHLYLNRNVTNAVTTPVTNIGDPAKTFSIAVFPNPIKSDATLQIENKEAGDAGVEIYNITGQKVWGRSMGILGTGVHRFNITEEDLSILPKGTYFLRVHVKNKTESGKIVLY